MSWIYKLFKCIPEVPAPCDVCKTPMKANGYGICLDCLEVYDTGTKDEIHEAIKAGPRRHLALVV